MAKVEWAETAVALKKSGKPIKEIAKLLHKSPNTLTTLFISRGLHKVRKYEPVTPPQESLEEMLDRYLGSPIGSGVPAQLLGAR